MRALFLAAFTLSGGLLAALCIPLIQRKVKPNRWYGLRTPRTLADPEVWYPANEYAGRRMFLTGMSMIAAAVGLFLAPDLSLEAYATAVGAVPVVMMIVFGIQICAFLRKFPKKKPGDKQPF